MNLTKLFEMQKMLDDRIIREKGLEGQYLLPNTFLALQVELGELANDWRGFKHWSNDKGMKRDKALIEYVDCLHFILSIGLQLKDKFMLEQLHLQNLQSKEKPIDTTTQFNELFVTTASLYMSIDDEYYDNADRQGIYEELFERFLSLGEQLGFTPEQIEQAYFEKNKTNHKRQENGY